MCPDKTNEKDFEVANNPFAFSPGQLNKTLNPKSLAEFRALGGLKGLERGLKTDTVVGLSVDEITVPERITFEEATASIHAKKPSHSGPIIGQEDTVSDHDVSGEYQDRKRLFSFTSSASG